MTITRERLMLLLEEVDETWRLGHEAQSQPHDGKCWCGEDVVETEGGYRWYCRAHRPRCRSGAHAAGSCRCRASAAPIATHMRLGEELCAAANIIRQLVAVIVEQQRDLDAVLDVLPPDRMDDLRDVLASHGGSWISLAQRVRDWLADDFQRRLRRMRTKEQLS